MSVIVQIPEENVKLVFPDGSSVTADYNYIKKVLLEGMQTEGDQKVTYTLANEINS